VPKVTKTIKTRKLKSTSNLQVKNRRTGEVVADVFVKNTQVGSPSQDIESNPYFKTYGIYRAHGGISGSLTRLTDGKSYLVAGSGVNIQSQSNGQVTISSTGDGSISTLTFGNGFNPNGETYNGTSDVSMAVDPGDGMRVTSDGVSLYIPGLSTGTPNGGNTIAIAQGATHVKATISDILSLGVSSTVTLSNALSFGNGIAGSAGSSYNNSAANSISVEAESNKGIAVTSNGVKIDPSNLNSATVATGDKVIIGDVNDSDSVKYVTAQSIANLATVSNLSNALTIGNGVQLDSGTTFDGSSARTLSLDLDGTTLSVGASGVSVSKVPNNLSNGNGINTFTFDGSSTTSVSAKIKSDGGLVSTNADGIAMQVSNLPSAVPVVDDYLSFYDVSGGASGMSKVLIQDFSDLFISSSNPIWEDGNNRAKTTGSISIDSDNQFADDLGSDIYFYVSGTVGNIGNSAKKSVFGGDVFTTGSITAVGGISGSITRLSDGSPYLIAGSNITISSASSGAITIASTGGGAVTGSISNVTQASPGVVTTVANHNLAEGQAATITDVSGMTQLNGNKYYADVLTVNTFALYSDSGLTTAVNTSGFTAYASGGKFTGESGAAITFSSGSTSVATVSTVNTTNLGTIQNLGGGTIAITGSIGSAEDGSYADGLFTDFVAHTPVGTAVDRFNEVLKGLAPPAAPSLDDMDSDSSGTGAKLSFGSSQSVSGYTNLQPSGLTPSSNLSNIDINGTYSSTTTSNDVRSACFNGSSNVEGTLNEDISADGVNYPANSFGNGDQGTLKLFVNNNSTEIHSTDLSSFGSGNSLNGNGSGFFSLGAASTGSFADGSSFTLFQHRTGSFRVHTADQRNGWNYARVTHTVGSSTTTTNYVEWINDSNSDALASAGSALDTLSMTGLRYLSGIKYNTAGTAQYRIRATNAYKNVYPTSNITFNGTNCSVSGQAFPSIDYAGGEDESKVLHITGSATINTDPILNSSISVSANVPAVLKSSLSSVGSQSISGILLYDLSNTSTTTSETFRRENYRLISGSYDAQSDVSAGGSAWDSQKHVSGSNAGHQDGMIFYNSRLYSPNQGGASGDFRNSSDGGSIANGPAENVNYSGITSGTRTFYRYFENNSGGSKSNFSLTINGSGTIVQQSTSLNTSNIHVLLKIPTTSAAFTTGWMDLAVSFATGQTGDGAGCLDGSLDSSLNATNGGTFGTQSVGSSEFIMVKIEADASWTGYISDMSITWS